MKVQTSINRKQDNTIQLTVTVEWSELKSDYDKVVEKAIKEVEVKGFRKGKAPRKIAEKNLDKEKVWQAVLEETIPKYYSEAVKKENLNPIISPQIQLLKAAPENDLVFKATIAEMPKIDLGDYKQALDRLKGRSKIWTPNQAGKITTPKENTADIKSGKNGSSKKRVSLNEIYQKLLETIEIKIPSVLVDQQTNSELANLIDEVKKVGMTIEQYAQTKGLTPKQLREQKRKEAEQTLKLEMILEKIADEEKITVEDEEIENYIEKVLKESKVEDKEKEKENLKKQRYFIASLLRRKKTLQNLLN